MAPYIQRTKRRAVITPQQVVEYSVIVVALSMASASVMLVGELAMWVLR